MRKHYSKEFKAKVALEALQGAKTLQELGLQYKVHPNQIALWKKHVLENAAGLFEKAEQDKVKEEEQTRKEEELYKQIGQLQVEKEFLKKKYRELYGCEPQL